ncbi:hypothetical protein SAMN04515673_10514 [Poseidonocella sedimentorum]|uniref:Spore protein YkvP/CgeB glycosyl transferase-like domain-containing protein n=2 Tax=Poseidonocella sedimentorum TaxID=871652 RepID=A0A1I6DRV1_9RHOB|nr:hypothetical protein SAMN04515673_10514 [Poseidonocella sedimentorum]
MLPCPPPEGGRAWGDYYFAQSLSEALNRIGVSTSLQFVTEREPASGIKGWIKRISFEPGVDLVIRGKAPFKRHWPRPIFIWLISQADKLTEKEISRARHIFVASPTYCAELQARGVSASLLLQCTDPTVFSPDKRRAELASDILFVGNRRKYAERNVVRELVEAELPIQVWGRGWSDLLPAAVFGGEHIPNHLLGGYYASANVVLNDHTDSMRKMGFLSNRAYDVLASGTSLVTERMDGVPAEFRDHIYLYDEGTAVDTVKRALRAPHRDRSDIAALVREHHSFDVRARVLREKIFGASVGSSKFGASTNTQSNTAKQAVRGGE